MPSRKPAAETTPAPTVWDRFDAAALHAESKDAAALVQALKAMTELLNSRLVDIEHSLAALAKPK